MSRRAIYKALFDLLSPVAEFKVKSRRLKHWTDVPPEMQPAFFMVENDESPEQRERAPAKWTLAADLHIYTNAGGDPDAVAIDNVEDLPSDVISDIIDAIEAAISPPPGQELQTLGGLVKHCWIAGKVMRDAGVLGPQSVAIVPIEMLLISKGRKSGT
jgi:hypothetical protein